MSPGAASFASHFLYAIIGFQELKLATKHVGGLAEIQLPKFDNQVERPSVTIAR